MEELISVELCPTFEEKESFESAIENGQICIYKGTNPKLLDFGFMYANSESIKRLPLEYQEKIKNKEPFTLEITRKEIISYNYDADENTSK